MKKFLYSILSVLSLLILASCQGRPEKTTLEKLVDDYIERVNPGFLDQPWVEGDTLSVLVAFGLPENNQYLQMDSVKINDAIVEIYGVLNWTFYNNAYPPPPPMPDIIKLLNSQDEVDSIEWDCSDSIAQLQLYPVVRCLGYTLFGPKLVIITVQDGVSDEYLRPFLDGITLYDLRPRADAGLLPGSEEVWDYNDKKFMKGEFCIANIFQLDTLGHGDFIRWHYH